MTRSRRTSTTTVCGTSGRSAAPDRSEVLGGAHALLHLIDFDEPFGFSVAEALACGTPVIAYDRGSMRELIRPGVDGFLTTDVDTAVAAVELVSTLDRSQIRASAVRRFDRAEMAGRYVAVYRDLLSTTSPRVGRRG